MKIITLISLILSSIIFGQSKLPNLNLSDAINFRKDSEANDVKNLLKLKNNDIAVSFYTNVGLAYRLNIDNFIFKDNGKVKHYEEAVYYKGGKKKKKNNVKLSDAEEIKLKKIISSDFFKNFSKLDQSNFVFTDNKDFSCSDNYVDDAPENFVMITQNKKAKIIMVYLPKNKLKCAEKDSPLWKFVELHKMFNIKLDIY